MLNNNFEELERNNLENLREPSKDVKRNVDSTVGIFRFVGDIVDLFLPKLMDIFLHVTGGEGKKKEPTMTRNQDDKLDSRYPNTH